MVYTSPQVLASSYARAPNSDSIFFWNTIYNLRAVENKQQNERFAERHSNKSIVALHLAAFVEPCREVIVHSAASFAAVCSDIRVCRNIIVGWCLNIIFFRFNVFTEPTYLKNLTMVSTGSNQMYMHHSAHHFLHLFMHFSNYFVFPRSAGTLSFFTLKHIR